MALEIQIMDQESHQNKAGLNRFMGSSLPFKLASGCSSVDNNDNGYKVMMMDNLF